MNSTQRLDEFNRDQVKEDPSQLVPVHISWNEVKYFNIMQGGQSVDETTGLREYSKLGEIVQIPEIQHIFKTMTDLYHSGKGIPEDIQEVINMPMKNEETAVEPIGTDSDPQFQEMDETGEGKDKILVMMPQSMVKFFDEIQGGEKTDPIMGLQEFGFFDEIVRGACTVGGAFLGGPVGAGVGNMVGRGLTGQKIGSDMLMGGIKTGLMAWAGSSALSSMGGSFGAMGSQAPGAWGMSNAQAAAPIVNGATGAPHVAGQGALSSAAPSSLAGASAKAPTMLSQMGSYLPSAGLMAAGLYAGHRGEKEKEEEMKKRYYADKEENRLKKERLENQFNQGANLPDMTNYYELPPRRYKKGGKVSNMEEKIPDYDKPIRAIFNRFNNNGKAISLPIFKKMMIERGISMPKEDISSLYHHYDRKLEEEAMTPESRDYQKNMKKYKKGGQVVGIEIKGRGTGQSDDIPKTVPENSWVWDATTVAHAGDGTTNAGQKAIKKFEDILKREKLPKHKSVIETLIKEKPLRKVPCALSNGERVTPPHLVAAAGDGDFDKGSAVLRKMTQELRRHKASKGLDLPPSAHDLTLYYKKAIRGV